MIHKTILKPIVLPGEINPTSAETTVSQGQQLSETAADAAWKAFSDGFKVGFAFPFAMLFGMGGCSDRETSWVKVPGTDKTAGDAAGSDTAGAESVGDDVDVAETAPDAVDDAASDICQEFCDADVVEAAEDVILTDVADGIADAAELPQDVIVDVGDTSDVYDSGICQYFCDVPVPDVPKETAPTGSVYSKMCSGGSYGVKTLLAPKGAVAAACTNETINYLIKGGNSCVAECGFFDNNVYLSTAPNTPVPFSTSLFIPPSVSKKNYTITLSLLAPVLSNGTKPGLPWFLGSDFVFTYKPGSFEQLGVAQWDAPGIDYGGDSLFGVHVAYVPYDYFFDVAESLSISFDGLGGYDVSFVYPCTQLKEPIIQCQNIKLNK